MGRFITLEGGEGAGKSTQAGALAAVLAARGLPVLLTREPGGAPGAERLRALLLSGGDWAPTAEVLLHCAARAEHVARTIRPALDAGFWVICDRFHDSTVAYQGFGQGADPATMATLLDMIGLVPDRTLILDVSEAVAETRLASRPRRPDRYERMGHDFHARVRAGFRAIAAAEPARCRLIQADGDREQVLAAMLTALD